MRSTGPGTGSFSLFPGAREAVAAAAEMQQALAREPWPPRRPYASGLGIHTGEPDLGDEGYVGMDVVVAARICAAGHGDQIIVSRATRNVAGAEPVPRRLVPIARPASAQGRAEHRAAVPARRSRSSRRLPAASDARRRRPFPRCTIASSAERMTSPPSGALLDRADVRLVTITGPGGAGKSRLALEVAGAAAVERPVHLVGLAPVSDPDLVPGAIARATRRYGVARPAADRRGRRRLARRPARCSSSTISSTSPRPRETSVDCSIARRTSTLLTTSRAPLRLSGEHVVPLGPLPLDDAAELFAELAAARGVVLARGRPAVGSRDLPAARRAAAGDRAGRCPPRRPSSSADPRSAGRRTRTRDGGARRPSRAATDAPRDDRVELRAPQRPAARRCTRLSPSSPGVARSPTRERLPGTSRASSPISSRLSPGAFFVATSRTETFGCRCSRPCASTRSPARLRRKARGPS